jgi:Ca-activated chloride channel family protein
MTPIRAGICTEGGTLELLIRGQAPDAPRNLPNGTRVEHLPLHLALVVDRSGSMSGAPLREALRCAEYIVTHLSAEDKVAIVVYDSNVNTLVPLRPTNDSTPFLQALRGVVSGGSTALHAGWLEGAKQLAPHTNASLSRVLLLSDGQANQGLTEPNEIAQQCRQLADAGVGTTTIGLGNNFNEDLMVAMARAGGGQHYYGQTAEDLQDAFQEELTLVQALYARHLTATLIPGPGVIVEVLSVPGINPNTPILLSDVAYGAEVWLLVRLHYTAKPAGNHALLSVQIKGETVGGQTFKIPSAILELPALPNAVWNVLPVSELVTRRITEVAIANLYDEVRLALKRQDRKAAELLLSQAKAMTRDNEWMQESVVALQGLMHQDEAMAAKEALYQSEKARRRQAAPNETVTRTSDTDLPAYLRRKTQSGKRA